MSQFCDVKRGGVFSPRSACPRRQPCRKISAELIIIFQSDQSSVVESRGRHAHRIQNVALVFVDATDVNLPHVFREEIEHCEFSHLFGPFAFSSNERPFDKRGNFLEREGLAPAIAGNEHLIPVQDGVTEARSLQPQPRLPQLNEDAKLTDFIGYASVAVSRLCHV
jgi:hypothetical protein